MNRREFLQASIGGLIATATSGLARAEGTPGKPEVVVLGFDGVDPRLVDRWVRAGHLPHLGRLRKEGTLQALASTSPPNSPVAWTTFATGLPPAEHGVFGFLKRDPRTYLPGTAPFTITGPAFRAAGVRRPAARAHRRGDAFWETLDRRGVSATLLFVPYAYPPPGLRHGRVLSGLGTPDLRFTNSSFTLFTSEAAPGGDDRVAGGRIVRLATRGSVVETRLEGPMGPGKKHLEVPLRLEIDRAGGTVQIGLGDRQETLQEGRRSGWFRLQFTAQGLTLAGRVRFHLLSLRRQLKLYASPIQLDPQAPALPLGSPEGWVRNAVEAHGGLPTVGWVHDTSAVNAGVLPKKVFLADLLDTMEGRAELLLQELQTHPSRLLVSVFTGTDRASHIFHRETAHEGGGPLRRVYMAMDRIIGQVRKVLPASTRLVVLSDHGFHPFDRMLHVNSWLEEQGLLVRTKPGAPIRFLRGVDWAKTQAYSMGNGQVYANLAGREASGSVPPGAAQAAVLAKVRERLLDLQDPKTGQRPVRAVYEVSAGANPAVRHLAPDLQVAFAPGYRSSWDTSLGGAPAEGTVLADNPKAWRGDHAASDVKETPGFIAANAALVHPDPGLVDLAATLLHVFGAKCPGNGRPLLT